MDFKRILHAVIHLTSVYKRAVRVFIECVRQCNALPTPEASDEVVLERDAGSEQTYGLPDIAVICSMSSRRIVGAPVLGSG